MGIPSAWFIGKLRPGLADTAADREQWAQHVADLEARRPFRDFEYLRRVDGEVRTCWIRSSGMPVFGENGQFFGYVGSASDVTEYKQAEERLRISEEKLAQAQKLETVGQLTGGIAHDFNNLLAVIQGNAEILGDGPDTDNPPVQTILRAAKRGAELTQRLLAYSRRQPLQPQAFDLSQLVVGLTDLLARTLGDVRGRDACPSRYRTDHGGPGPVRKRAVEPVDQRARCDATRRQADNCVFECFTG
jgi:signal transduction histidine kinase